MRVSIVLPLAIAWLCCSGCTEYLGPPASPAYWREPPAEQNDDPSDPGPQSMVPPGPAPMQPSVFLPPPVEDQAPRSRARSISLGYTGDGVLAGGITRDTVIEPAGTRSPTGPQNWQGYVNAPKWRTAPLSGWTGAPRGGFLRPIPGCGCACPADASSMGL